MSQTHPERRSTGYSTPATVGFVMLLACVFGLLPVIRSLRDHGPDWGSAAALGFGLALAGALLGVNWLAGRRQAAHHARTMPEAGAHPRRRSRASS